MLYLCINILRCLSQLGNLGHLGHLSRLRNLGRGNLVPGNMSPKKWGQGKGSLKIWVLKIWAKKLQHLPKNVPINSETNQCLNYLFKSGGEKTLKTCLGQDIIEKYIETHRKNEKMGEK